MLLTKIRPQCGLNEIYICGKPCIETCDYKPLTCNKNCIYGCFCNATYVRKSNATGSPCILKSQCTNNTVLFGCGANEVYTDCGSPCPPSCTDLYYPQKRKSCTIECVRGCFCQQGLYRAENGTCVRPEECCQGQNEQFTICGTPCPARCNYTPGLCAT
ncbi:unnamed protein product, partial [Rotaria sp. Silwood2]